MIASVIGSRMMLIRVLRVVLPIALGGTFGLQHAHADIYTWVDASGSINVSNLAPPDGARVTSILHASTPAAAGDETARDAARQAKTQALEDRVRQLENEVELSRREVPPPVEYRPIPVPPVVQYIIEPPPVLVQHAISEPAPANNWCDPNALNCGLAWAPWFYPGSVVVLRAPTFQHFRRPPGRHVGTHAPMRTSLIPPLATPVVRPPLPPPLRSPASFRRG